MYQVTAANLARWFPDALLTNPLRLERWTPRPHWTWCGDALRQMIEDRVGPLTPRPSTDWWG